MNDKPLVSIIIPLYNGSNYVEEAIQSALAQTYKRIEIVVVNDGSTDNGAGKNICDRYSDRIVYLEKENGGCASALNFGIRYAQGDFISWLSHDDLYTPQKLEKQVSMYEKYALDKERTIISSCGALINGDGTPVPHPGRKATGFYPSLQAFSYVLLKSCPNGCGLLIPKKCFEQYGYFDESLRFVLDWYLWLKFALLGVDYYFDDEKLVYNRVHGMQVTVRQKERHATETDYAIDQLFAFASANKLDDAYLRLLYYFSFSCKHGDTKAMRTYLQTEDIPVNSLYSTALRMKRVIKQFVKEIYHRIR